MTNLLYPIFLILLIWSDHFLGYDAEPIVGGRHDRDNEAIWQVSFQEREVDGTWDHLCGGSIISDKYVVTAAHCFVLPEVNVTDVWDRRPQIKIVIGTNDLNSTANPGVELKIDKVILPKAYSNRGGKLLIHDVAVVRLKNPLDLSINGDKYGPIHLFDPKNETERKKYDDQVGFVAGFGAVKVLNVSHEEEKYVLDGLRKILPVHFTDINCPQFRGLRCLRYEQGVEEPIGIGCGDSGGPLYYRNDNGFELVGVISAGPHDCDIRKSTGKFETVMFIPDYKDFLDEAKILDVETTFPEMSVDEFEKLGVDYIVLPDQAKLARNYYALLTDERKAKKPRHCRKWTVIN